MCELERAVTLHPKSQTLKEIQPKQSLFYLIPIEVHQASRLDALYNLPYWRTTPEQTTSISQVKRMTMHDLYLMQYDITIVVL